MAKPDVSSYTTFEQITGRLDEIISVVRSKDTSLERSLDLFDEALALGSVAVDLVDTTDFTPEEEARLAEVDGEDSPVDAVGGATDGAGDGSDHKGEPEVAAVASGADEGSGESGAGKVTA